MMMAMKAVRPAIARIMAIVITVVIAIPGVVSVVIGASKPNPEASTKTVVTKATMTESSMAKPAAESSETTMTKATATETTVMSKTSFLDQNLGSKGRFGRKSQGRIRRGGYRAS